jgi:hypothetical protein
LVSQIASLGGSGADAAGDGVDTAMEVSDVAEQTVRNVSQQFRKAHLDAGVGAAFEYLVILAAAGRSDDPRSVLSEHGIELSDRPTPLSFAKAASSWLARNQDSLEYGQMARGAVSDTIGAWYRANIPPQDRLFEPPDDPFDVWRRASDGAGFCELARLFFARFTERHLNYYLEREASAVIPGLGARDEFGVQLNGHVDDISQHAFETARIAQSFAAGWFTNNAKEGVPDREAIARFLSIAFGKIRGELLREDTEE